MAGLGANALRKIPVDADFRMDLAAIGYNFRLLIAWITLLWAFIQTVIQGNAKTQFV
jgi:hypothetical protein